eukprot:6180224-Pleurochrysis_carterae.AAC.1
MHASSQKKDEPRKIRTHAMRVLLLPSWGTQMVICFQFECNWGTHMVICIQFACTFASKATSITSGKVVNERASIFLPTGECRVRGVFQMPLMIAVCLRAVEVAATFATMA